MLIPRVSIALTESSLTEQGNATVSKLLAPVFFGIIFCWMGRRCLCSRALPGRRPFGHAVERTHGPQRQNCQYAKKWIYGQHHTNCDEQRKSLGVHKAGG